MGKNIKIYSLLVGLALLMSSVFVSAHPRHNAPVFAELNDYLPAIYMLKENDKKAEELFKLWLSVRQASWDIRKSIDENGLNSGSPKVIEPVIEAKIKRNQLVEGCRVYFASQTNKLPTVKITVSDKGVKVDWNNPVMKVEQWSRKIVLIEIRNEKNDHAHITMKSDTGRQILFWQKYAMPNTVPKSVNIMSLTFLHLSVYCSHKFSL